MSKPDAKELMAAALGARPTAYRNRRPLPDAFRTASYDLAKAVDRLRRLVEDDRYPKNAEQVARMFRGDLLRASDGLAAVVTRVSPNTEEGS